MRDGEALAGAGPAGAACAAYRQRMGWKTTEHPRELLDGAGPFLRAHAASHTVLLTTIENLIARGPSSSGREPPLFGWWTDGGGAVSAAFMHTPPHPLYLSALPPHAVQPLADLLAGLERALSGVDAHDDRATLFTQAWTARRDVVARTSMRTRLYRLATLRPPRPAPPGRAAAATGRDRDLLIGWLEAFARELGALSHGDTAASVDDRLGYGGWTLWHDQVGAPVALAGISRPVRGSRRIAPVFTPEPHRRRGYGAAVTAAACRHALDAGAGELLLFADVANATSNALYRRLGFEPVEERTIVRFDARTG